MPKIDLTITVSVIVALAAVISPILTTLINNHHQTKLRMLELKHKHYEQTVLYKRNIFENYLKGLSMVSQNPTMENIDRYSKYYSLAYMYLPEHIRIKMSSVNNLLHDNESIPTANIDVIATDICAELQKM